MCDKSLDCQVSEQVILRCPFESPHTSLQMQRLHSHVTLPHKELVNGAQPIAFLTIAMEQRSAYTSQLRWRARITKGSRTVPWPYLSCNYFQQTEPQLAPMQLLTSGVMRSEFEGYWEHMWIYI